MHTSVPLLARKKRINPGHIARRLPFIARRFFFFTLDSQLLLLFSSIPFSIFRFHLILGDWNCSVPMICVLRLLPVVGRLLFVALHGKSIAFVRRRVGHVLIHFFHHYHPNRVPRIAYKHFASALYCTIPIKNAFKILIIKKGDESMNELFDIININRRKTRHRCVCVYCFVTHCSIVTHNCIHIYYYIVVYIH